MEKTQGRKENGASMFSCLLPYDTYMCSAIRKLYAWLIISLATGDQLNPQPLSSLLRFGDGTESANTLITRLIPLPTRPLS
jgi:hypothetical protein